MFLVCYVIGNSYWKEVEMLGYWCLLVIKGGLFVINRSFIENVRIILMV